MSAYLVAALTVNDPERFAAYAQGTPPVVAKHGGEYIVRGGSSIVFEGQDVDRVVVIRFPSLEAAESYYRSDEYTALHGLREGAADGLLLIAEGVA